MAGQSRHDLDQSLKNYLLAEGAEGVGSDVIG